MTTPISQQPLILLKNRDIDVVTVLLHLGDLSYSFFDHKFYLLDLTACLKTSEVLLPLSVEEVFLVV